MIGKNFYDLIRDGWWGPSILPVIYEKKKPFAIQQKTLTGSEGLSPDDNYGKVIFLTNN